MDNFLIEPAKHCKLETCWVWSMCWCNWGRCAIIRICLKCVLRYLRFKWRALHFIRLG